MKLDEVFLDALQVVVLAALERIGNVPEVRFRFFRRLLAIAHEAAGNNCLSYPSSSNSLAFTLALADAPVTPWLPAVLARRPNRLARRQGSQLAARVLT